MGKPRREQPDQLLVHSERLQHVDSSSQEQVRNAGRFVRDGADTAHFTGKTQTDRQIGIELQDSIVQVTQSRKQLNPV